MSTLFFEGFERGYIYNELDSNWTQDASQSTAANPLYSFGGYTSMSGVQGEYCWELAAERYLEGANPSPNLSRSAIKPAQADYMWQYATSKFPTQLMTGITIPPEGWEYSCDVFSPANAYPCLGTPPGFLSLTNINGRDIFNYSEIDSVNITGMNLVTEGSDAVFFGCRWLGMETKHPDFIARDKAGRYGDRHPLVSFCSGEQELLFSLVNVSGTGWFQDRKIDGDRTAATMGLRVEQNGVLKGVFDLNISGVNGVNNFQIQTIADQTGQYNMDIQTGKILGIQNIVQRLGFNGQPFPNTNEVCTMSRWAFLNIEIRYEPAPYVSLQIEGVDAIAIPLDDPTVNLNNRNDPNIDYVIPIDVAHFNKIRLFNRTYDPDAKFTRKFSDFPYGTFECDGITTSFMRYPSYYVMEGSVVLIDDVSLVDTSTDPGPNMRVGPDSHVCRLFPGLVAHASNTKDAPFADPEYGLGDDYMFLDGKSEWTAEYEQVEKAAAFTGYNPDNNRGINAGTMVGIPDKPQKRAAVKDADCTSSYIHAFKEGQMQTMPFLPLDFAPDQDYSPYDLGEYHVVYDPNNPISQSGFCTANVFISNEFNEERRVVYPGDGESAFRYYLASGIAGIKVYNQYFPRSLNSSFENIFWGPESDDWPDIDLYNIETQLIWYDRIEDTTNVFDTGHRINATYYPDDRMAWVTGLGYNVQAEAEQVREFYDLWGNGRGINLSDAYVLPYMANLSYVQFNQTRYGAGGDPDVSIANKNYQTWRCSGTQSGMPWGISAWVYFKEEDDIIHLHSRYLDNELGVSGVVDFQRNYKGDYNSGAGPQGSKFPEIIFTDCTTNPQYCQYYNPAGWNPDDFYSVINQFWYNFNPDGPSNWPTGLGAYWPYAVYATRSGIRIATIGAETNTVFHRFGANPNYDPFTAPDENGADINTYNVPETWQWSGTLDDPLIYRDFFFSGEIPVGEWCHIEINKDVDRYVRVFCSGVPSTGHQVVAKSHPQDYYYALSTQMLGEEVTGPTTGLYQFNHSGFFWRNKGVGDGDQPPLSFYIPTDTGPMFNSLIAIQGSDIGNDNHMFIIVPPRVGPNVQIEDYVYVTGAVLHTGAFPVPDKWIPIVDDFYNSCEVQMTGNTECNTTNYYLYNDPVSEQIWDSGLFIEPSGFRFGVRKT